MADQHFIVATAGHVDHGKSALVRALTGTDPDRLPEEKARGITIDLGFANLALPALPPSTDTLRLGIVDVPGHEDFVKNMVAGVGSVDVALLAVAADDGWMPQTEEHLQILAYLGVERAVVALTKADAAPSLPWAVAAVQAALRATPFENAPIIPTSVITGQGIDALKAALARTLADAPPPRDDGKPRLPIDRVFTLRGVGTVVTGTLTGGALNRDETVIIQPGGRTAHVRALQNHGHDVSRSVPGTRTALNLPGLDATGNVAVVRGEVVTRPALGGASDILDVLLTRTSRVSLLASNDRFNISAARPLKNNTHVRVYHGSGSWTARVRLLDGGTLPPGGRAMARLRLDRPIFAFAGDRFVVRDGAERTTVAGGIVLDPLPGRRSLRRAPQRDFLTRRAAAPGDCAAEAAAFLQRDRVIRRTDVLLRSPYGQTQTADAVQQLVERGIGALKGDFFVDAVWWDVLLRRATELVDKRLVDHPESAGLPIRELRHEIERGSAVTGLFDVLAADLVASGEFIREGAAIRRATHRPTLPPALRAAGARLRAALAAKPFEPPSRAELTPDAMSRQALRFLCETGEAIAVGEELILLDENYKRIKGIIVRTIRAAGPATASDLRQVIGTTRRVMIPVLELLDKEGITVREGDRRKLKNAP